VLFGRETKTSFLSTCDVLLQNFSTTGTIIWALISTQPVLIKKNDFAIPISSRKVGSSRSFSYLLIRSKLGVFNFDWIIFTQYYCNYFHVMYVHCINFIYDWWYYLAFNYSCATTCQTNYLKLNCNHHCLLWAAISLTKILRYYLHTICKVLHRSWWQISHQSRDAWFKRIGKER